MDKEQITDILAETLSNNEGTALTYEEIFLILKEFRNQLDTYWDL